jgi:hypothetical protein
MKHKIEFTPNELLYIKVTLMEYGDIKRRLDGGQDREWARVINRITDKLKEINDKEELKEQERK